MLMYTLTLDCLQHILDLLDYAIYLLYEHSRFLRVGSTDPFCPRNKLQGGQSMNLDGKKVFTSTGL